MHGLWKGRDRHRGVRSSLLILAPAVLAVLAGGCSDRAAVPPAPRGSWFQLQGGRFRPVEGPTAASPVSRAPWTVQSRVADMAWLGDSLYCALNGAGLVTLNRDASDAPSFSYHEDALIFAHRTITTLVPSAAALTVHLYYNALLNDAAPQTLSLSGISLVRYLPDRDDYAFVITPFQRSHPDWEAVGFGADSDTSFHLEWKFTDGSETRFQYTRFHADTRVEEPENRDTFLDSLGLAAIDGPSVPSALAAFFSSCGALLPRQPPEASREFILRLRESPVKRTYRSRKESEAATRVPVYGEQGNLYALLPDGRVLAEVPGSTQRPLALPRLPGGFHYTDLVKWGSSLVLPWEEASFTDVGRAGILIYPLSG